MGGERQGLKRITAALREGQLCSCSGPSPRARGHRVAASCPSVADAISSTNPRVIDDARARKLSSDLKRCTYYETCATYGLNVERVFQDGKCTRGRALSPARVPAVTGA